LDALQLLAGFNPFWPTLAEQTAIEGPVFPDPMLAITPAPAPATDQEDFEAAPSIAPAPATDQEVSEEELFTMSESLLSGLTGYLMSGDESQAQALPSIPEDEPLEEEDATGVSLSATQGNTDLASLDYSFSLQQLATFPTNTFPIGRRIGSLFSSAGGSGMFPFLLPDPRPARMPSTLPKRNAAPVVQKKSPSQRMAPQTSTEVMRVLLGGLKKPQALPKAKAPKPPMSPKQPSQNRKPKGSGGKKSSFRPE
jgi:hypothetical protein